MKTKKAILAVSFGTSCNDTREKTIGAVEKTIANTFPDYEIRRAFTSKIIIGILKSRDNTVTDDVDSALEKLVNQGFTEVIVQPTHIINGIEYDLLQESLKKYKDRFDILKCGRPLLSSSADFEKSVQIISKNIPEIKEAETAVVFMGHGTEHYADTAYAALDYRFKVKGFKNVYVGTVEGYPDTEQVINYIKEENYKNVVLYPFMIVAGDHANNDMAGEDEDSWKTLFENAGYNVKCVISGLGEIPEIREMFVEHIRTALSE